MARVKESPEDFFVREIKRLKLKQEGRFAYFLMKKKGMTTQEAVDRLTHRMKMPASTIGIGGLKDKNAITEQYISIEGGKPEQSFEEENLKLIFLGFGDEPVLLGDIEGNYFEVVVRGVPVSSLRKLEERINFVKKFGFENYFGEQRFGSVKHSGSFITKYLLERDYEGALKEYLTSLRDRSRRKKLLRTWGRWKDFVRFMPQRRGAERRAVELLLRGAGFREAFDSLPKSVKLMLLFAYQSYLWNRYLNTFVVRYFKHCSVKFLRWRLSFITQLNESIFTDLRELSIPLLGTEHVPENRKIELIIEEVLKEEGITEDLLTRRVSGLRLFTDGVRRAFVFPEELNILEIKGRDVKLSFTLPPGSYATVLLRKLLCTQIEG